MIDLESARRAEALAIAIDFAPDDVEANRKGLLSEKQKKTLIARYYRVHPELQGFASFVMIIVIGIASLILAISANQPLLWILPVIFAGIIVFGLWEVPREARFVREDIAVGIVRSVEGSVTARLKRNVMRARYPIGYLHVKGLSFRIPTSAVTSFDRNKRYCLYYVPITRLIVSVDEVA